MQPAEDYRRNVAIVIVYTMPGRDVVVVVVVDLRAYKRERRKKPQKGVRGRRSALLTTGREREGGTRDDDTEITDGDTSAATLRLF